MIFFKRKKLLKLILSYSYACLFKKCFYTNAHTIRKVSNYFLKTFYMKIYFSSAGFNWYKKCLHIISININFVLADGILQTYLLGFFAKSFY